jgi:hypothetical protein
LLHAGNYWGITCRSTLFRDSFGYPAFGKGRSRLLDWRPSQEQMAGGDLGEGASAETDEFGCHRDSHPGNERAREAKKRATPQQAAHHRQRRQAREGDGDRKRSAVFSESS